jgi:hypothetical protein
MSRDKGTRIKDARILGAGRNLRSFLFLIIHAKEEKKNSQSSQRKLLNCFKEKI